MAVMKSKRAAYHKQDNKNYLCEEAAQEFHEKRLT